MKKLWILLLTIFTMAAVVSPAWAGVWGDIQGKLVEILTNQLLNVLEFVFATLGVPALYWLHNKNAKRYDTVARTLKESGEAVSQMGNAMISQDKEDLKKVAKEVKDVFDIGKQTPERFVEPK